MPGVPPLSSDTAGTLALVACGVAVLALFAAVAALARLRAARRALTALIGPHGAGDVLDVLHRIHGEASAARRTAGVALEQVRRSADETGAALRHVSVVRYDAFGDQGGRLSFSAALLDDAGDGLVLTSINGRTETRTYAKGVTGGCSEHGLSPEEEQAVQHARGASSRLKAG
jgi:hypothetical protein